MNHLRAMIDKYERRAMAYAKAECDWEMELRYEAWEKCYDHIRIRDAVRYPGRVAEPSLKQWLNDHRQEYEEAKIRIYEELEKRSMKKYRTGYVRGVMVLPKSSRKMRKELIEKMDESNDIPRAVE